ncbi:hypothetical protein MMC12_001722 [Toensbergia leucococca]|nr:hypothetical protein [Toensbergia leucococca]
MSDPINRYQSIANSNPFSDELYNQPDRMHPNQGREYDYPHEISESQRGTNTRVYHNRGMPQSRSESHIKYRGDPVHTHAPRPGNTTFDRHDNRSNAMPSPILSSSRGRAADRTPSPVKYMDDINEDQVLSTTPTTPAKRSRSPIKQVLENSWLGRSTSMKELPSDTNRKNGLKHWGGRIKQRVSEDVSKLIHHTTSPVKTPKSPTTSTFPVSLSPPVQAKLYSEVELMICATANQYLMTQNRESRMTVESLLKITQWWASKNRPQVIEFQFDQLTQRDLVLANLKTFRFYGPHAENPVSMNAMMLSWKSLAKEMSVRTFCTPDSVVRKHMHDCYKILEMLGAPLVTFLAFQEIQVRALGVMREVQRKRDEYEAMKFGVERRWEPPAETAPGVENPFP